MNRHQTEFSAGDIIIEQGTVGDCAYIIESGSVDVFITHPNGAVQSLAHRGPGAMIGEMALVDRKRRTASVRALEDCKVIVITEDDFKRRLDKTDPVIRMTAQVILARYRDTLSRIDSFGTGNYAASEEIEKNATSPGRTVEHLKTTQEFRAAIANGELRLYYQPVIDMATGAVTGFEALMRWIHPERGFIPPNLFIPLAEESGLIVAATDWAVREACNALNRISAAAPARAQNTFMSINFTAQDMLHDDFISKLDRVSHETGTDPRRLKLEMTERLLMNNPQKVRAMLDTCKAKGYRIAIDDFGTGYSSLSYLHHYPIDTLKIDRSFVVAMTKDEGALNLVRGIITLGQSLKMDLIAEGIEEEAEERLLLDAGCAQAQGFRYAKPMPEEALTAWLNGVETAR